VFSVGRLGFRAFRS